jgi:mono/diheme cytochrome c family protein
MKYLALALMFTAGLFLVAACGGDADDGASSKKKTAKRVARPNVPDEYAGKTVNGDAAEGKSLYDAQCASCHGPSGDGKSPVGQALDPPAGDLTSAEFQNNVEDDYIYWRIAEGGAFPPFNSGMTPFKDSFTEEQIGHIVAYIRSLKS